MTYDVIEDLRACADELERRIEPVTMDEVTAPRLTPLRAAGAGDHAPSRSSRRLWLVAASVAALLVTTVVWLRAADPTRPVVRQTTGSSPAPVPDTTARPTVASTQPASVRPPTERVQFSPGFVPEGFDLWYVDIPSTMAGTRPAHTGQIIESPAIQARILLDFAPGSDAVKGGEPTTVRGQPATIMRGPGADSMLNAPAGGLSFFWVENGTAVRAHVRGLSETDALAVLASERWRDPARGAAGFAPPTAPGWQEHRIEQTNWLPENRAPAKVELLYARSAPTPGPLSISVTVSPSVSVGEFLASVADGEEQPDGSFAAYSSYQAIEPRPGEWSKANGRLLQTWPDGHQVRIVAAAPAPHDRDTLIRIAQSVKARNDAEFAALLTSASDRRASAPRPPDRQMTLIGDGPP